MAEREQNARGSGERLRTELVAAASSMLTTPQPASLPSLRAVARACGVSASAVYLHFDSQVALVRAVVDLHLDDLRRAVMQNLVHETPAGTVQSLASGYAHWALEHPGAYQLVFETAPQAGIVSEFNPADGLIQLLTDAIASARPAVDVPRAAADALVLWGSVHGLVLLRIHKPHLVWPRTLDGDIARLIDALLLTP